MHFLAFGLDNPAIASVSVLHGPAYEQALPTAITFNRVCLYFLAHMHEDIGNDEIARKH